MTIQEAVEGKRILIWGYGREGKASERYLKGHCNPSLVDIYEGDITGIDEDKYDLILKSPGIVMKEDRPKYTSQTELFLMQYRNQVIGITGTKGKSTTSALTAHILKACTDRPVILLGNIGLPCMDYCGEITDDTIIVFELSCHQLKFTKVSPHISVFLNLYEEHLDYYGTMDAYFTAKSHITAYQKEGDYFLCGVNVPEIDTAAEKVVIDDSGIDENKLSIFGRHNQLNAKFARFIAQDIFGCDSTAVSESMKSFTGLSHRLQSVGCYDGINWYDDSISTIPEAAISALESIPNIETILIGGMDRGISYEILENYMKKHKEFTYICMYETGKRIVEEIKRSVDELKRSANIDKSETKNEIAEEVTKKIAENVTNCEVTAAGNFENLYLVEDLSQAVALADRLTSKGKGCVMSPAAASYGYFKNFEERGDKFCEMIKAL